MWRVFRLKRPFSGHNQPLWTVIFWLMACLNLGTYWIAYPLIGWVLIGIILIFVQAIGNHEFVYNHYWPVFWKLSFFYSALAFAVSIFLHQLPLV